MFHFEECEMTDLFQWSRGVVIVFDLKYVGKEVHFSNDMVNSYTRVIDEEGKVEIPDFLLVKAKPLEVYLYITNEKGAYTKERKIIRILARPKPYSWVDPEVDQKVWDSKVDKYWGEKNAGKLLYIGEDGNVASVDGHEIGLFDKTLVFVQDEASDTWTIEHNLEKFPSVTVVDSANDVVVGDIEYVDENNLVLKFSGPFSGKAFLN